MQNGFVGDVGNLAKYALLRAATSRPGCEAAAVAGSRVVSPRRCDD